MHNTVSRCEYNKVVHENDELHGDIIVLDRVIDNLQSQLARQERTSLPQKISFWSYFWFFLCCGISAASTSYIYTLKQELAHWKCTPTYQAPSSPTEN